ncbi:MAG: DUF4390 domain-containing protein [Desulfonatronovibrio sp.]
MKKQFIFILISIMMPVFLVQSKPAFSQNLDLSSFVLDTRENNLLARFSVEIDDFDKIASALENGAELALVCEVSVLENRTLFWDQAIVHKKINIEMEKNLLAEDYIVVFPDQKRTLDSFGKKEFLELFEDMDIELLPLEPLQTEKKYIVRIQVKLISRSIPKWIKRTLFFWSWDLAGSIHYEMEFSLKQYD